MVKSQNLAARPATAQPICDIILFAVLYPQVNIEDRTKRSLQL